MQKPWLASYDEGVHPSIDYPVVPIYQPFLDSAGARPDAAALIHDDRALSYGELAGMARRAAGSLTAAGVGPGARVAIMMPDCPFLVAAYYAVLMTGSAAVMLSPRLVERELEQQLEDTTPDRMLTIDSFESLLEGDHPAPSAPPIDPRQDTAVFIYTGGTTGMPKAVMLTHYAVVANALQLGSWVPLGPGDVTLAALPMFHSFGMSTGINTPLFKGATAVIVQPEDTAAVAAAIERHRPGLLVAVPATVAGLVEDPGAAGADLSSLRYCFAGSAMLPRKVKARFEEASGAAVLEGYGLTEAVTAQSANPARGLNKAGSIGLPMPYVEFRVVDIETGTRELPPEKVGELTVRSPCLMQGYYHRPAETAKTLRDGWLFTSDIGWMDGDGYFYIIDRKKDLVVSGAFKTYPAEVEQVLLAMPGVKEAVVVGLFDDFRGHSLKAYVVPEEGAALTERAVIDYCHANLSSHKVPRVVVFRKQLPRNALGKILREELE